jgi:hypothetical protein
VIVVLHRVSDCCFTQSEWLLFYTEWVIVVLHRVSDCCFTQSKWLLFYTEWVIVVLHRVSDCCFTLSEWLLFYTEWVIVVLHRVSDCCFTQSEWLLFYTEWAIVQLYHRTSYISMRWYLQWIRQHANIYNANSLKQQSVGRHVAPLWHKVSFSLMLSREADTDLMKLWLSNQEYT